MDSQQSKQPELHIYTYIFQLKRLKFDWLDLFLDPDLQQRNLSRIIIGSQQK